MKNIIKVMLVLAVTLSVFTGCNSNKEVVQSELVELTDRQVEILTNNNLSTDYYDLTSTQKEVIMEIENVLQYLENKYCKEFGYIGYNNDFSGTSCIDAYALDDDKELGAFQVYLSKDGYTDNYISKELRHGFKNYIKSEISSIVQNRPFNVFIEITDTTLSDFPEKESMFDGNVEYSMCLFIDSSFCTATDIMEVEDEIYKWMSDHDLYGIIRVLLLNANSLDYLTSYNYTDYLGEGNCSYDNVLYIQREN